MELKTLYEELWSLTILALPIALARWPVPGLLSPS